MPDETDELFQYLQPLGLPQQQPPVAPPPSPIPVANSPFVTPPFQGGLGGNAGQQIMQSVMNPSGLQRAAQGAQVFGEEIAAPEEDADLKKRLRKLLDKYYGDNDKRERELAKLPRDYEADLRRAYYGDDPKNPVAKGAKNALMMIGAVLGAPQPDFRSQSFEIWKNRQKQLSDERMADKALVLGQLNSLTQLEKSASGERQTFTRAQAAFMGTALKDASANAQNSLRVLGMLQQDPKLDAEVKLKLALTEKTNLENTVKRLQGIMGGDFSKLKPDAQITMLMNAGMPEQAQLLLQIHQGIAAMDAMTKGGAGGRETTRTSERFVIDDPVTGAGHKEPSVTTSVSSPTGGGANTAVAQQLIQRMNQTLGIPQAPLAMPAQQAPAAPAAPSPFLQQQSAPVQPPRPAVTQPQPLPQASGDSWIPRGAEKTRVRVPNQGSSPNDETPSEMFKGYRELLGGHAIVPNLGRPDPKETANEKAGFEARKTQQIKADAIIDEYANGDQMDRNSGVVTRFANAFGKYAGAGNLLKQVLGPDKGNIQSFDDLLKLAERDANETGAILPADKMYQGSRITEQMVKRVQTMYANKTMSPEIMTAFAMYNNLVHNTAGLVEGHHMDTQINMGQLRAFIANRVETAMNQLDGVRKVVKGRGGAAEVDPETGQSKTKTFKDQSVADIKKQIDPSKVLADFLRQQYPQRKELVSESGPYRYHLLIPPANPGAAKIQEEMRKKVDNSRGTRWKQMAAQPQPVSNQDEEE